MGEAKNRPPPVDMKVATRALTDAARASRGIRLAVPLFPLSERVKALCATVSPHVPVLLPFREVGEGYQPRNCHTNVKHRVGKRDGQALGGWIVWENPGWAELEAHAVWVNPKGDLVDVTPRPDGEELILFVPDPRVQAVVQADRQIILSNRTSIPGCPYVADSRPVPGPAVEAVYDDATRKEMQRLGVLPP
jgi:hypothetical protein